MQYSNTFWHDSRCGLIMYSSLGRTDFKVLQGILIPKVRSAASQQTSFLPSLGLCLWVLWDKPKLNLFFPRYLDFSLSLFYLFTLKQSLLMWLWLAWNLAREATRTSDSQRSSCLCAWSAGAPPSSIFFLNTNFKPSMAVYTYNPRIWRVRIGSFNQPVLQGEPQSQKPTQTACDHSTWEMEAVGSEIQGLSSPPTPTSHKVPV